MFTLCIHILLVSLIHFGEGENDYNEGWFYRENPPTLYFLSAPEDNVYFSAALSKCEERGANLSSPSTQEEMDFLVDAIYNCYAGLDEKIWVNLRYPDTGGPGAGTREERRQGWVWGDGSPYTYPAFDLWVSDEPESDEAYARIKQNKWLAEKNNKVHRYLCEKELGSKLSTFGYMYQKKMTSEFQGSMNVTQEVQDLSRPECANFCAMEKNCAHFLYDATRRVCKMMCAGFGDGTKSFVKTLTLNVLN